MNKKLLFTIVCLITVTNNIYAQLTNLSVDGTFILRGANIDSRFAAGNLSYLPNSGKLLIGWNRSEGGGETDFISNQFNGIVGYNTPHFRDQKSCKLS